MNRTGLHQIIINPAVGTIHYLLKYRLNRFISSRIRTISHDRTYFHLIIIRFLDKAVTTTFIITRHILRLEYGGRTTGIILFCHTPIIIKIGSYRTGTPSLSEGERIGLIIATYTKMQSITVTITDSSAPRCKFIIFNGKHGFGIYRCIIFYPLQSLTGSKRKIFYRTFIGICPQITKLRNKTITRIIHTIINIPNHILLGQSCPIRQIN